MYIFRLKNYYFRLIYFVLWISTSGCARTQLLLDLKIERPRTWGRTVVFLYLWNLKFSFRQVDRQTILGLSSHKIILSVYLAITNLGRSLYGLIREIRLSVILNFMITEERRIFCLTFQLLHNPKFSFNSLDYRRSENI